MRRITTDEQLNELVAQVQAAVSLDKMEDFLEKRLTAHDKVKRVDAYLTLKEGRVYLPYPYAPRFKAIIMEVGSKDEYDI